MQYTKMFEPYQIRGVSLKNRLISAPCERNYANTDGSVTQRYIDFLVERAKGGVGLINIESIYIDPVGRGHIRQLGLYDDTQVPGYRQLTDAVHANGAKLASHLVHSGRETSSYITGLQPVGPSSVPCTVLAGGDVPRELTIDEIERLIEKFGQAARRSIDAGFDIIEIHGAHGYLVGQFLSPFSNRRNDAYGGTFVNRMRFPLEVVAKVRSVVGDTVPIAYRMSADEKISDGLTLDDSVQFSKELERKGVDLIDVSAGIYESVMWIAQPMSFERGCLVGLGDTIKKNVNIPVSVAGRINHPDVAEEILASGKADFISMGRSLHADAYWPQKVQEGRIEDIRICPACMDCSDQLATNQPITCAINPAMGRESEFVIKRTPHKKKVLVVGAGPAGLEAARVADLRGHEVFLCEKLDRTGGQLYYATKSPHKQEYTEVIRYLNHQIEKSSVDLQLETEVTTQFIDDLKPDAVIVATGARPSMPFTPGVDKAHVHTAIEILNKEKELHGKTAILGAGLVGLETAIFLVENKVSPVIIVEPTDTVGGNIGLRAGWTIRNDVKNCGDIEIRNRTTIEQILDHSVMVQKEGCFEEIAVDNVVIAVGMRNNNELVETLRAEKKVPEIYSIGDCNQPRTVKSAIEEAAIASRKV